MVSLRSADKDEYDDEFDDFPELDQAALDKLDGKKDPIMLEAEKHLLDVFGVSALPSCVSCLWVNLGVERGIVGTSGSGGSREEAPWDELESSRSKLTFWDPFLPPFFSTLASDSSRSRSSSDFSSKGSQLWFSSRPVEESLSAFRVSITAPERRGRPSTFDSFPPPPLAPLLCSSSHRALFYLEQSPLYAFPDSRSSYRR